MSTKITDIESKKELLSNGFHQYYFITLDNELTNANEQPLSGPDEPVNVVIPIDTIMDTNNNYGLAELKKYINEDYSNFVITNADNFNIIHQYETYKKVFFIKLKPYTSQIALHILPKSYDATDNILFLKDDFINNKNYEKYSINKTNHYEARYINNNIRVDFENRHHWEARPFPAFSKFDEEPVIYYRYTENNDNGRTFIWTPDTYEETYGEFEFDIRDRQVTNPLNTQINVGYRYNTAQPNAVHYTGIKDVTNENVTDRCALIDANLDNIANESNVITKFEPDNEDVVFPTQLNIINEGFTNDSGLHTQNTTDVIESQQNGTITNIQLIEGKTYHKTIKYFNDAIYSEEFDGDNKKYMFSKWQ